MALYARGDLVAVERKDNGWSYGILRDMGYTADRWLVEFEDGLARIPHQLIYEEATEGEAIDRSKPVEYASQELCPLCTDAITPKPDALGRVECPDCGVYIRHE